MAKTVQQGYYKLKGINKWMHFSMNCWINLKQDSGKDIGTFGKEYDEADTISRFIILCEVAQAALKAYDQEQGNDIDYDIYKVRAWMEALKEDDAADFMAAMSHSINLPVPKKDKAKK